MSKNPLYPQIFSGEPITDRKSTFQAFLAQVVHQKQAMCVLEKLKQNKKIANATHNMWAFRIGGAFCECVLPESDSKIRQTGPPSISHYGCFFRRCQVKITFPSDRQMRR